MFITALRLLWNRWKVTKHLHSCFSMARSAPRLLRCKTLLYPLILKSLFQISSKVAVQLLRKMGEVARYLHCTAASPCLEKLWDCLGTRRRSPGTCTAAPACLEQLWGCLGTSGRSPSTCTAASIWQDQLPSGCCTAILLHIVAFINSDFDAHHDSPKEEVNQDDFINRNDDSDIFKDIVDDKGDSSCLKSLRKTRLSKIPCTYWPPLNPVFNRRSLLRHRHQDHLWHE